LKSLEIINFLKYLFIYLLVQTGRVFPCSGFFYVQSLGRRSQFVGHIFLHLLTSVLLTDFSQKLVKNAGTAGTQEREV
jgi:hypothetical protein